MRPSLRFLLLLAAALALLTGRADAQHAGLRQTTIAHTSVALYYPSQTPARSIPMGAFTPQVGVAGVPDATFKGLILLSHGIGGSELSHGRLAEGLARAGYLVAALRHPGDNWQDHTLVQSRAAAYFSTRPRQVSAVLDALLNDPQWKDRISRDAQGPKIGALGHSAGGYTVLALAGGTPDLARLARHCQQERAADPVFCRTGQAAALGLARKRFMKQHGRVFWILGIMQYFWYSSDKRREKFVKICEDKDVQRLTWQSYMNKELVRRDPMAHVRIFFKDLAHLFGFARA
jgi:predicted dienelactone hydrolase